MLRKKLLLIALLIVGCEEILESLKQGCTTTTACNYNAEAMKDDGSCEYEDCAGECGGDAEDWNNQQCCEDVGGAWMGDSCCSSGILDCNGDCNGDAVVDECGECGGTSILSGCDNVCNSTAVEDCAGVCGGDADHTQIN